MPEIRTYEENSTQMNRELEISEGIKCGLADVKAGRVVPHEQVMNEAREIIAKALQANAVKLKGD